MHSIQLSGVFLGTNCSVKMNCPISGLQRHNAVVLGIESLTDNTVGFEMYRKKNKDRI